MPGYRGDVRVTRDELGDAIRQPLDGFITVVHETLQRNGIRTEDLAAIASVGGGASIPAVTTTLSQQLGAPIITAPRPHLTPAIGAALRAAGGPADGETAMAPTAAGTVADTTTISNIPVEPRPVPALAWSEAGDDSDIMPIQPGEYPEQGSTTGLTAARSQVGVDRDSQPVVPRAVADAWYRRPAVVIVGTALLVLAVAAAIHGEYGQVRSADPRAGDGLSQALAGRRATTRRPAGHAAAICRPPQNAPRHGPP